jgi:hypothetical protein
LTFQIPSAALFSALDTLRNTPVATNLPPFNMGPVHDKIRPSAQGELSTTTNGILPLSLTNAQPGEPLLSSRQYDEERSRTDRLFGFSTAPKPWADCFANLFPESDWMPSTNSSMCHYPVINYRRGVSLTSCEVSNPAYSSRNSEYPTEKVSEHPFYPVTCNDLRRQDHTNATANQREVVWCSISLPTDLKC